LPIFPVIRRGMRNVKGVPMKKIAMSALMVGALGLTSVVTTSRPKLTGEADGDPALPAASSQVP
jgi:hypothetical protein